MKKIIHKTLDKLFGSDSIKKLLIWCSESDTTYWMRHYVILCADYILKYKKGLVTFYTNPTRNNILNHSLKIKTGVREDEAITLLMAIDATSKIKGEIAEVGVYGGGTAKLLRSYNRDITKHIHLFDTFEGLPNPTKVDIIINGEGQLKKNQFSWSYENVQSLFANDETIHFYKGYFPDETGHFIESKKFSLVHLDMDLYEGTLAALKFFYPRMNPGGIIISHDYNTLLGVRKAFDEFFINKKEPVLQIATSQCLVSIG